MKTGMKYNIILDCGFGGTPICPIFESANIDSPIITGMIRKGSARERSGSNRNGPPQNAIVFENTKKSPSSPGMGSSIGKQPPNPQSKMMLYFMPVFMTVLFLNFASGLNQYYASQNLFSIPQQYLIAKRRLREAPVAGGGARAPTPVKT